jgi:hypothetical protein
MKIPIAFLTSLAIIAAAAFASAGCGKKTDSKAVSVASADVSNLEAAFASADATTKAKIDAAIAALKSADYTGATMQLKSLGSTVRLTAEQQAAINEVVAKVKKDMATQERNAIWGNAPKK